MSRNPGTPPRSSSTPRTSRSPRTSASPRTPTSARRDASRSRSRSPVGPGPGASGSSSPTSADYEDEVDDEDLRPLSFFRIFRDQIVRLIDKLYDRYGDPPLMWMIYHDHDRFDRLRQFVINEFAEKYFPTNELDCEDASSFEKAIDRLRQFAEKDLPHVADELFERIDLVFQHVGVEAPIVIEESDVERGKQCCICQLHIKEEDKNEDEKEEEAESAQAQAGRLRYIVGTCEDKQHQFHSVCIYDWLKRTKSCPMCRTKIIDMQKLLDKIILLRQQFHDLQQAFLGQLRGMEIGAEFNFDFMIENLLRMEDEAKQEERDVRAARLQGEQDAAQLAQAMQDYYASLEANDPQTDDESSDEED